MFVKVGTKASHSRTRRFTGDDLRENSQTLGELNFADETWIHFYEPDSAQQSSE